jgi:hypothetical protein
LRPQSSDLQQILGRVNSVFAAQLIRPIAGTSVCANPTQLLILMVRFKQGVSQSDPVIKAASDAGNVKIAVRLIDIDTSPQIKFKISDYRYWYGQGSNPNLSTSIREDVLANRKTGGAS